MAKMYIANCTNFKQVFCYRIPGAEGRDAYTLFELSLPPRGQDALPHDLPALELEMIAEKHQAYGMVEDRKVHNVKGFNGLIYKIGSPVDMERVEHVVSENMDHLEKEVDERMKMAVLSGDHAIKSALGEESGSFNQIEVIRVTDKADEVSKRKSAVMAGKQDKKGR